MNLTCRLPLSVVLLACASSARGTIRYVDDSAPPGGDGLSWGTASNNLFSTLLTAHASDEIRVGAGTYKPSPASSRNTAYFALHDGMILRGGYAGYGALNPDEQNPAYTTILSGDLNGNDGPNFTNRSDNAYHVVIVAANTPPSTAACTIDSFTIVGGQAEPSGNMGGGVQAIGPSVITRCIFRDNYGGKGGALYVDKPCQVSDCTFEFNRGQYGGGAIEINSGTNSHTFRRCVFRENVATAGTGGAVDLYYCNPLFVSCTFVANQASGSGGGIKGSYMPLMCINCGFFGNTSGNVGGGLWVEMAGKLIGCVFSGNTAGSSAGAANGIEQMYNCTIANNRGNSYSPGGIQGAYNFTAKNSILWGNSDPQSGSAQSAQFTYGGGSFTFAYNIVQGWTGLGGPTNSGSDPLFILPAGVDGIIGTNDDNLRLATGSPAIDSGDNAAVPADSGDVDLDGNTTEPLPLDIDGNPRIANDASTPPDAAVVDRGGYENDRPPPRIIAWRSLRLHGPPSPEPLWLPIPLNPAASGNGLAGPTTEPRNFGLRRIEVDFSTAVQLKPNGSLTITGWITNNNGQISGPINMSGNAVRSMADADTLQIDFGSMPDRACITLDVSNTVVDADNNPLSGDKDCTIRVLRGDETSSGDVTLSDAILTQGRLNLPLAACPACDVNLDGVLDSLDVQFVKGRILPIPQKALCP